MSTSHPKSAIFAEYVQRPTPEERKLDVSPEVENVMKAMAKTLAEAMRGVRVPFKSGSWPRDT